MQLRELIQKRFAKSLTIFDRFGQQVPDTQLKAEYQTIRQYLLDHHAGQTIAINQVRDYRYFFTIIVCQEIGITYIPMKYDYPESRIQQIQEDSKFTLLFNDQKMNEVLTYTGKIKSDLPEVSPEQNAYIIFTSGSTGRPKGVIIQRKALVNFFDWVSNYFSQIQKEHRLLQVTEFTFDISLVDVGLFLSKGLNIYFSAWSGNMFKFGHEVDTYRISTINTVPNNLNMFLSDSVADRIDYKCLKHLLICGSRFSYGLYEKCRAYFPEKIDIYNLYGPTESTVYSHGKKLIFDDTSDCIEGNVSIGTTLTNVQCIVMKDGKVAEPYEHGELLLSGIQLLKEYCNNPEQTEKAITHYNGIRYYHTGDISYMDDKGDFYVVGRNDDTIKYRGFRINLLDIDSYISKVPYVADSVTVAVEDDNGDNLTLGFVILKETKTVKEFKKDLATQLLDYQIPEKIFFVKEYPTNVSGKVCKKTLKANYIQSTLKV